jgi:hypothetical protein
MTGQRSRRAAALLGFALLLAAVRPGGGEEVSAAAAVAAAAAPAVAASAAAGGGGAIGAVALVQGTALAMVAGQPPRQLRFKDPVADGLRVRLTGRDAALKVRFFHAAADGIGTYTLSGPCEAVIRQGTGESPGGLVSTIQLLFGRLRLALLPGRGEVAEVQTPDAVMGIKGTAVRLLVDPAIGTFVAVDEGIVSVQARAGGRAVMVKSGHWVLVPPGGLPTRPMPGPSFPPDGGIVEDPPLLGCCVQVEPPKPRGR